MQTSTATAPNQQGLIVETDEGLGILHALTGVIAAHLGDIRSVSIVENTPAGARIYFEVASGQLDEMIQAMRALPIVRRVDLVRSMEQVFGKRIIIMGGGAQVGQVAVGAIVEAHRHNIRGEHIS